MEVIKTAILGASGYTGAELLRLLSGHPHFRVAALTADRKAGQPMAEVFPHFAPLDLPDLVAIDQVDFTAIDAVFCCLPHGTTQEVIAALPGAVKVCDLSADFRLRDVETYAAWYGHPHRAAALQLEAVYGLTELARSQVRDARLVANPGCYPTSAQLPLIPLLRAGLIAADDILIDAMSGVSGAGRAAKEANLFTEVAEGIHPYGLTGHRHAPEIEQGLSDAAGRAVTVGFVPHLMPMNRGMLSTIHVRLAGGADADTLRDTLRATYAGERFVRVLPPGGVPSTRATRGSNLCLIGVFPDRVPGRAIVVSAIDNLVKGASGQALQNMNLMFGLDEGLGLTLPPLFP